MVRTLLIAAMMASISGASSAQTVDQFDLICTGESTHGYDGAPQPATRHYRIDLAASRWCMDECTSATAIQTITADALTLQRKEERSPLRLSITHEISRTSGKVIYLLGGDELFDKFEGECVRAPFSGMPTPKF